MNDRPKIDRSVVWMTLELGEELAGLRRALWDIYGVPGRADGLVAREIRQTGRAINKKCEHLFDLLQEEAQSAAKHINDLEGK